LLVSALALEVATRPRIQGACALWFTVSFFSTGTLVHSGHVSVVTALWGFVTHRMKVQQGVRSADQASGLDPSQFSLVWSKIFSP